MLKRLVCSALIALAIPGAFAAQQGGVPALSVTAPNGKKSILLGSVHVGIAGLREPSSTIFEDARLYVVEHKEPTRQRNDNEGELKEFAPWAKALSKEQLTIYLQRAQCGRFSWDSATVQMANLLAYTICGQPPSQSRDDLLLSMRPANVPMAVLENEDSVEEKRRKVEKLATPGFRWILEHDPKSVLQGIKTALNEGDYDSIQQQFRESLGDTSSADEFCKIMIDVRNVEWMPRLKNYLDDGKAVILVGAMHLPGPNGLIALLRAAGYKVEPMSLPERAPLVVVD